jgi:glycosyltransferase involved in cell wall biosynthesis
LDSALAQDFWALKPRGAEILVFDDSGADAADYGPTEELMREYCAEHPEIVYYRHARNIGEYPSWNRAIEICQSAYGVFLHDDIAFDPDCVSSLVEALGRFRSDPPPGAIGVFGRDPFASANPLLRGLKGIFFAALGRRPLRLSAKNSLRLQFPFTPGMLVNREAALASGGQDETMADLALAAKLNFWGSTYILPRELLSVVYPEQSKSLSLEYSYSFVTGGYRLAEAIARTLGKSGREVARAAARGAMFGEIAARGYNDVDFSETKRALGMGRFYSRPAVIQLYNLYQKFLWALLAFNRRAK